MALRNGVLFCATFQQQPYDLNFPKFSRSVKGVETPRVLRVNICPSIEEKPDFRDFPALGDSHQWCGSFGRPHIDWRAPLDQELCRFHICLSEGPMQGC